MLYDGQPRYAQAYAADRLLSGRAIETMERTGGASEPGVHEAALTLASAVIRDEAGNDVMERHGISYVDPGQ